MKLRQWVLTAAGLCAFGVVGAQAQVMDFESFDPQDFCDGPSDDTLMEGGLVLTANFEEWCVFGPEDGDFGGNANGTNILGWCGDCSESSVFNVERADGGAFDVLSIDVSSLEGGPEQEPGPQQGQQGMPGEVGEFLVRGFRGDGSTVEFTIQPEFANWQSYPVSGVTNVERIEVGFPNGSFEDGALDNIVTGPAGSSVPVVAIPVPADRGTGLLVLLVLSLGLWFTGRLRNA